VIVFVSVDEDGKPIPVKRWIPKSEREQKKDAYAVKLKELRTEVNQEMLPFLNEDLE